MARPSFSILLKALTSNSGQQPIFQKKDEEKRKDKYQLTLPLHRIMRRQGSWGQNEATVSISQLLAILPGVPLLLYSRALREESLERQGSVGVTDVAAASRRHSIASELQWRSWLEWNSEGGPGVSGSMTTVGSVVQVLP